MSTGIVFRSLTRKDIPAMMKLYREAFPMNYPNEYYETIIHNKNNQFYIRGAFEKDDLVGIIVGIYDYYGNFIFASHDPNAHAACVARKYGNKIARLVSLAVTETHRRQGIGARLLIDFINALNSMGENGPSVVSLNVMQNNLVAKRLYDRIGFKFFMVNKNYYRIDGVVSDGDIYVFELKKKNSA